MKRCPRNAWDPDLPRHIESEANCGGKCRSTRLFLINRSRPYPVIAEDEATADCETIVTENPAPELLIHLALVAENVGALRSKS